MDGKIQLRLEHVNKTHGNRKVLDDVSLILDSGKFYCLIGPVGAGKTTLLRVIAGLEEIDGGTIEFGGKNFLNMGLTERNVAMVFQDFVLYPHFTVFENIASPMRARRISPEKIQKRVEEIAGILKIAHTLMKKPRELSGGEMQRVAIARALAKEADVYLFDEILVNLDYKIREEMRPELRKIAGGKGKVVLFSTSDPIDALSMGDYVVVMDEGKVLQFGETREVYENPQNLKVGKYLGFPAMNVLRVSTIKNNSNYAVSVGTHKVIVKDQTLEPDREISYLGIRPEDIKIFEDKISTVDTLHLNVECVVSEVIGSDTIVTTKFFDQTLVVFLAGMHVIEPGEFLEVHVDRQRILLFDQQERFIGRGL